MVSYEIAVYSLDDQTLLFRAHGTRSQHESSIPRVMLDELGRKYGECRVVYNNLSEGWKAEKEFY